MYFFLRHDYESRSRHDIFIVENTSSLKKLNTYMIILLWKIHFDSVCYPTGEFFLRKVDDLEQLLWPCRKKNTLELFVFKLQIIRDIHFRTYIFVNFLAHSPMQWIAKAFEFCGSVSESKSTSLNLTTNGSWLTVLCWKWT